MSFNGVDMRLKTLWGVVLVLAVLSSHALSDEKPTRVRAVLAEVDYPPFYYVRDGEMAGISIEVLNHISNQINLNTSFIRLSWPRVLKSLEDGSVDLVTTFFNTAERAPFVVYTGVPHAYEINTFFALKKHEVSFNGHLESLSAHRIGMIRGYSYGHKFD